MWTTPRTWVTSEFVTAAELNEQLRDNMNAVLPVGSLIYRVANVTGVETAVEGRWLECNGVAVSRTTYAALFNYLNALTPSLPFGVGNGSTTFHLPDMRGRMPVGIGSHADVTLGDNDGVGENLRKPKHYHESYYGTNSVGGSIPNPASRDNVVTGTFPTTPTTDSGAGYLADRANHPKDAPAYLVAGVYFIKYTS